MKKESNKWSISFCIALAVMILSFIAGITSAIAAFFSSYVAMILLIIAISGYLASEIVIQILAENREA